MNGAAASRKLEGSDFLVCIAPLYHLSGCCGHHLAACMWTVEPSKALNARLAAAVEDPFDATDNCARTIGFSRIDGIVDAFGRAAAVMNAARDDAGSFL